MSERRQRIARLSHTDRCKLFRIAAQVTYCLQSLSINRLHLTGIQLSAYFMQFIEILCNWSRTESSADDEKPVDAP